MFHRFSKKSFLLFYLAIFFSAVVLAFGTEIVLAGDNSYGEMFSGKACPENCTPAEGSGKHIRLQVYLPIADFVKSCTYTVDVMKDGKKVPDEKQCYYVESNLPLFIKKAYSFSIGLIAIMAVIIIMIGGVKWILAAGNPGSITDAKNSITAAVSGLVLALLSYAILYTINPNLTNLQFNPPSGIETREQSSYWCKDDNNMKIRLAGTKDDWVEVKNANNTCGFKYEIENSRDENGNLKTCWGNGGCEDKEFCYQYAISEKPYCYSAENLCKNYDKKSCDKADATIKEYNKKYGCAFRNDYLVFDFLNPDQCVYNSVTICNKPGESRISCFDDKAEGVCWIKAGTQKIIKTYLSLDAAYMYCVGAQERAVDGASYACCLNNSDGTVSTSFLNLCSKITTCTDYMNKEICEERDDCGVGPCQWTSNGCTRMVTPNTP